MKILRLSFLGLILALVFIGCGESSIDDSVGKGGPNISPFEINNEDIKGSINSEILESETLALLTETEEENDLLEENEPKNDLGNNNEIEEEISKKVDDVILEESQKIINPKIELDVSKGKWKEVIKQPLETLSLEFYKDSKNKIKEYNKEIKILRDEIKKIKNNDNLSKDEIKTEIKDINLLIKAKRDLIKDVRSKIGYSRIQSGVFTNFANQPLYLNVNNVTKTGWYRLRLYGKNVNGKLPDFYKMFNISVINETTGKNQGGIFLKASEDVYNTASMLVYIEEGDSVLNLLWTNDAYKKNEYDTNLQIKKVSLKYSKAVNKRGNLSRNSFQYDSVDGRFFWDEESVRTYWANQTINFNFPDLKSGKYKVIITAKNYGLLGLSSEYKNFEVDVDADGVFGRAKIKADADKYKNGSVVLDLTGGDTYLSLTWVNDSYKEGEYDANIQIKKIRLKRVGDSERSAITSYLFGSYIRLNRMKIFGTLIFLLIIISGLVVYNKRENH